MAKAKILHEILSPEKRVAGSTQERTRAVQQQELQDEIAKRESFTAPDGAADVTSAEQQQGRPLRREDFVQRLQKLNSNLVYQRSANYPEFGGLYAQEWIPNFETHSLERKLRHLCGFPHEIVGEFDTRLVIQTKIPDPTVPLHWIEVPELTGHIPGWRSTILKLVRQGYINLTAAEQEFRVAEGRSSERWQQAVH